MSDTSRLSLDIADIPITPFGMKSPLAKNVASLPKANKLSRKKLECQSPRRDNDFISNKKQKENIPFSNVKCNQFSSNNTESKVSPIHRALYKRNFVFKASSRMPALIEEDSNVFLMPDEPQPRQSKRNQSNAILPCKQCFDSDKQIIHKTTTPSSSLVRPINQSQSLSSLHSFKLGEVLSSTRCDARRESIMSDVDGGTFVEYTSINPEGNVVKHNDSLQVTYNKHLYFSCDTQKNETEYSTSTKQTKAKYNFHQLVNAIRKQKMLPQISQIVELPSSDSSPSKPHPNIETASADPNCNKKQVLCSTMIDCDSSPSQYSDGAIELSCIEPAFNTVDVDDSVPLALRCFQSRGTSFRTLAPLTDNVLGKSKGQELSESLCDSVVSDDVSLAETVVTETGVQIMPRNRRNLVSMLKDRDETNSVIFSSEKVRNVGEIKLVERRPRFAEFSSNHSDASHKDYVYPEMVNKCPNFPSLHSKSKNNVLQLSNPTILLPEKVFDPDTEVNDVLLEGLTSQTCISLQTSSEDTVPSETLLRPFRTPTEITRKKLCTNIQVSKESSSLLRSRINENKLNKNKSSNIHEANPIIPCANSPNNCKAVNSIVPCAKSPNNCKTVTPVNPQCSNAASKVLIPNRKSPSIVPKSIKSTNPVSSPIALCIKSPAIPSNSCPNTGKSVPVLSKKIIKTSTTSNRTPKRAVQHQIVSSSNVKSREEDNKELKHSKAHTLSSSGTIISKSPNHSIHQQNSSARKNLVAMPSKTTSCGAVQHTVKGAGNSVSTTTLTTPRSNTFKSSVCQWVVNSPFKECSFGSSFYDKLPLEKTTVSESGSECEVVEVSDDQRTEADRNHMKLPFTRTDALEPNLCCLLANKNPSYELGSLEQSFESQSLQLHLEASNRTGQTVLTVGKVASPIASGSSEDKMENEVMNYNEIDHKLKMCTSSDLKTSSDVNLEASFGVDIICVDDKERPSSEVIDSSSTDSPSSFTSSARAIKLQNTQTLTSQRQTNAHTRTFPEQRKTHSLTSRIQSKTPAGTSQAPSKIRATVTSGEGSLAVMARKQEVSSGASPVFKTLPRDRNVASESSSGDEISGYMKKWSLKGQQSPVASAAANTALNQFILNSSSEELESSDDEGFYLPFLADRVLQNTESRRDREFQVRVTGGKQSPLVCSLSDSSESEAERKQVAVRTKVAAISISDSDTDVECLTTVATKPRQRKGDLTTPKAAPRRKVLPPQTVSGSKMLPPAGARLQCKEGSSYATPTLSFLSSLCSQNLQHRLHPDAVPFTKNFTKNKDALVEKLYKLFNVHVFEQKLPESMKITWNVRLRKTAGYCYYQIDRSKPEGRGARIELSTKVVDTCDRLRDTLIHELCHAAAWIISGYKDGHGPLWKAWAHKASLTFPELPRINRCHSYEISCKYTYRCTNCGYSIGRHSKSLDTERKICGRCKGRFELLVGTSKGSSSDGKGPLPSTPRTPAPFAQFVKENYSSVKRSAIDLKHADVMKILSEQFKEMKVACQ